MPNKPGPRTEDRDAAIPATQTIITIPPMETFDDVRRVVAQVAGQMKTWVLSQLPPTNFRGKRISNVGIPQGPDDVVTLRYLTPQTSTPTSQIVFGTNTVNSGGGGGGANIYTEVNPTGATTINPPTTTAGTIVMYRIKMGATPFAITWGTAGGVVFKGPPVIPSGASFANTYSTVSFVCGSDLNLYVIGAELGFTA